MPYNYIKKKVSVNMRGKVVEGDVFIVWSKNNNLADAVRLELNKTHRFEGVVGGQSRTQQTINTQVMEQIQSCSYAIILITSYSPNLMYEWGYIVAKYDNENILPVVIDLGLDSLPSDLQGCWAESISSEGKNTNELAKEIVELFINREVYQNHNKTEILLKWNQNKEKIKEHLTNPSYSHLQIANLVLHSIQAAYYNHDLQSFQKILQKLMKQSSTELISTFSVALHAINFYIITENQQNTQTVDEIEDLLEELEHITKESDLNKGNEPASSLQKDVVIWKNIILYDFIGLCYMFLAEADSDMDYFTLSKQAYERSVKDMVRWKEEFPKVDAGYLNLWEGYFYRNLAVVSSKLGKEESAKKYFKLGKEARELFYRANQYNALSANFNLEFLLINVEEMLYFQQDLSETINLSDILKIEKKLKRIEVDYAKQHALLGMVRSGMKKINKEKAE